MVEKFATSGYDGDVPHVEEEQEHIKHMEDDGEGCRVHVENARRGWRVAQKAANLRGKTTYCYHPFSG